MTDRTSGSACEVHIDEANKTVRKRVHFNDQGVENGHDKLWYEIKYLQRMNKETRFFPKVLGWFYQDGYLNLDLEYLYNGESLADIILDGGTSTKYIGGSLSFILDRLFQDFYKQENATPNPGYWQDCYIERTRRRVNVALRLIAQRFPKWTTLKSCIEDGIVINGIYYAGIEKYMSYLRADEHLLSRIAIANTYRSHHDLIPENILVSRGADRISDFKLIDPRGDEETGQNNRHFIYDMGKMLFGLDCYGLFRRGYHSGRFDNFSFSKIGDRSFRLSFDWESIAVKHLISAQDIFERKLGSIYEARFGSIEDLRLQLLFSFACMYIPDVPCRMIDEQDEDLALIFYARGCMILHKLFLYVYGRDIFSSDQDGRRFDMWPTEAQNGQ